MLLKKPLKDENFDVVAQQLERSLKRSSSGGGLRRSRKESYAEYTSKPQNCRREVTLLGVEGTNVQLMMKKIDK